MRRTGIVLQVLFLVLSVAGAVARKPNVVVILTDDQGWGDLGINGNTNLDTPNIDRLARDGARFDHFYVCPVCSPTRAEFLTGRYHARSGVYSTSAGGERMNLDEKTIADAFQAAGYATGAFGKWHNGMQYPYHPNGRGFDEFYGFCSGHWGHYFSPPLDHNGRIVRGKGFVIDDFTDRAMAFMEANRDQPFFAYLPYNTPHSPMQVPDRWWDKYRDRELKLHHRDKKENELHLRAALAMCENIDWNVGRLLKKLNALGIADNTIVVYFCDNGPNGWRWNGGLRGRKGSTDEGGVRSPLFIRWPGRIKAGTRVKPIAGAIDLLPTLCELAGVPRQGGKPLDGISLKPALLGESGFAPDRKIFSHWRKRVSLRTQTHRLDDQGRLYNIPDDPGQRTDLSAKRPGLTRELRDAVQQWRRELLPGLGEDGRPFLIGHPDSIWTQVPARDAKAGGSIKRSNKFPNCSFFGNWTSPEESMTWEAEVVESGDFEVELHYACPEKDIGSTVELSFNRNRISAKLTEPHDPPLKGAEQDRSPRSESYVKDWKSMNLGVLRMEKGSGTLMLRPVHIPGSQVMEFRLLMFRRLK